MQYLLASILLLATVGKSTQLNTTEACTLLHVSKSCKQYTLPINITSLNVKWAIDPLENNQDMAAFNANWGRRDSTSAFHPFSSPPAPETAVYTISGTFCEPVDGGSGTVLLATHGGAYGRNYWDPDVQPEKYSFVDFAIAKGYSVFFYDRVGLGQSEIISGYVSQASMQVAILTELTKLTRSGKFSSNVSKIVLLGHSLGSLISNAVLNSSPDLVDAALLTGIAYNSSSAISNQAKQLRLANLYNPLKWSKLDGGYTVLVDIFANLESFFKAPFYDAEVAQWAQDNQLPTGLLESITGRLVNVSSPAFTGPVMIMCGEYDFIACGGYCPGFIDARVHEVFPASKKVVTYSHPNSGHAINLSLNATGSFEVLINFLKENGL